MSPDERVGVDLGIANLAVLSTGELIPNPRHLNAALGKLQAVSRTLSRRRGPNQRTGQRPSARWQEARAKVTRLHARVGNLRKDGLHKLTTNLARRYGTVVVEDLNVAGMLKNRNLARNLSDASFGEIRRLLAYKTNRNGGALEVADRWFPSSKVCSTCGSAKPKLSLRVRIFTCGSCGLSLDRDLNAAINLKMYVARSGRETTNGRGADQKTRPGRAGGCETPTPHHHGGEDGDRPPVTVGCEPRAEARTCLSTRNGYPGQL